MANYHVLRQTDIGADGEVYSAEVVLHVPVPADAAADPANGWTNRAGKSLRTCLTEDPDQSNASALPAGHLAAGEAALLAAGQLVEVALTIKVDPKRTPAQQAAALDGAFPQIVAETVEALKKKYRFWGLGRNV